MLYGLDIGGTKIELAAFHNNHQILTRRVATPTHCYHAFKSTIQTLVFETDTELKTRGTVGIGLPGIIDPISLKSYCANIPCANNQNLIADLEFVLDRPVRIENDANCFILSESHGGSAAGFNTALGIILGTGCGGGLYINGKLHKGRNNTAGEWGHVPLPYNIYDIGGKDFPIIECGCGRKGCLDSYLSARGLELLHQHYFDTQLTAKDIINTYQQQNNEAIKTVHVYCELLACSLASLVNTMDPDIVVVGGGLSNFDNLYQLLPDLLDKYTLPLNRLPEIRKAIYGDSSGVRGAALLNAYEQYQP